jgi:hypothetical protein
VDSSGDRDPLSERVIGLAIDVHRTLGPGLLESAYDRLDVVVDNADPGDPSCRAIAAHS